MPEISVARRYADAMIDVAAEQNAADAIGIDLDGFTKLLDAHDGLLRRTLCTPVFSTEERTAVLQELLPKLGINPLTANFLSLLNDKGRLSAIDAIASAYRDRADEKAGRLSVRVTTAEAMSADIAKEVKAALSKATGKDVVLAADVDPDLIGGMVVRVAGRVYDSSIRTRLQDVRRTLLSAQTPAVAK